MSTLPPTRRSGHSAARGNFPGAPSARSGSGPSTGRRSWRPRRSPSPAMRTRRPQGRARRPA
eukprot:5849591-Alexandrium_andersonii.AAC.1